MKNTFLVVSLLAFFVFLLKLGVDYDSSHKAISCDFTFGAENGTDRCLILAHGTKQGIQRTVFEVQNKRFSFNSLAPRSLEQLNGNNQTIASFDVINQQGQCHPGGKDADIYSFRSGDKICLYW